MLMHYDTHLFQIKIFFLISRNPKFALNKNINIGFIEYISQKVFLMEVHCLVTCSENSAVMVFGGFGFL